MGNKIFLDYIQGRREDIGSRGHSHQKDSTLLGSWWVTTGSQKCWVTKTICNFIKNLGYYYLDAKWLKISEATFRKKKIFKYHQNNEK